MEPTTQQIGAFIEAHGFDWYADSGSLVITIPWYNPTTGEEGADDVACHTLCDVRAALGY